VQALAQWHAVGGTIDDDLNVLADADLVVDALFGIGLDRAPDDAARDAIAAINRTGKPVLALDVPSGLNADTGHAPGVCVHASVTLSFIAWKRGLWTGVAAHVCGDRQLATLSVPQDAFAGIPFDAECLTRASLARALPPRARDAHKGSAGHVLVIGGDLGFGGAVMIAAMAAARSGAGLVNVATRAEHVSALIACQPELMARGVTTADELDTLIARADVIAIGPGLGQSPWGLALALRACASGKSLVLDADALSLLALRRIEPHGHIVLTPHPGEASRLLGCTVADVERDRHAAVRAIAEQYQAVVVLKGAGSLIADVDGSVAVCPFGNPGMASGGMGDALTGVVAALWAQGLDARDAARTGVLAHALAGDRAARAGERGLLAMDVVAELRAVVNP
jgi:NAD(P)H-hydrate epimerase